MFFLVTNHLTPSFFYSTIGSFAFSQKGNLQLGSQLVTEALNQHPRHIYPAFQKHAGISVHCTKPEYCTDFSHSRSLTSLQQKDLLKTKSEVQPDLHFLYTLSVTNTK